jgi:hypothetical protein
MNILLSKTFKRVVVNASLQISATLFLALQIAPINFLQPCAAAEPVARDIFSTPDATATPVFSGRNRPVAFVDPLFGPNGDPPTREAVRAIPSITGPQLKQLDDLINQNRDSIQPLQDQVTSLRHILDDRKQQKPIPGAVGAIAMSSDQMHRNEGSMMMEGSPSDSYMDSHNDEPDDAIKNHIDLLNAQIKETRGRLWPGIRAMLSPQQLDALAEMHSGKLIIAKNSPTDLPEPPPPPNHNMSAKPGSPGMPGTPYTPRPFPHPASQPHLIKPLLYSTQQVLYRNLWRL